MPKHLAQQTNAPQVQLAETGSALTPSASTTKDKQRGQTRKLWILLLNVISCVAVVMLHSSLEVFSPTGGYMWVVCLVTQACFIFAVSVFFMISGATLMNYVERYSPLEFIKRRFLRVGLTLCLASIGCYLLYTAFPQSFYSADIIAAHASPSDFLARFSNNSINDTYWFLYTILKLYVGVAVLSCFRDSRPIFSLLVLAAAFVRIGLPLAAHWGFHNEVAELINSWLPVGSFHILMGWYLVRFLPSPCSSPDEKGDDKQTNLLLRLWQSPWTWALISLACVVSMSVLGLRANGWPHHLASSYQGFWIGVESPFGALLPLCVFQWARSVEAWLASWSKAALSCLKWLARCSLGIYLIHIPIVNNFAIWEALGKIHPYLARFPLSKALVIFSLSLALVSCYQLLSGSIKKLMKAA